MENLQAAVTQAVTADQIPVWEQARKEYQDGKRTLDERIIKAEEYWKLRHWRCLHPDGPDDGGQKASGWLVNVILSKHSDAMDAYPETICLAREEGDKGEAEMLGKIIPVIKTQNDYEQVWSDVWWQKLKSGTGVTGYFWDKTKCNGLGDIAIRKVDILNLSWEPGISDIQRSKYLFYTDLVDNDALIAQYPELQGRLSAGEDGSIRRYLYDETISTRDKSTVVDVYYKKNGLLHMAKYVGDTLLTATENDPELASRGLYDHAQYPFVFDPLYPEEGYPECGYGIVDLCRDSQDIIDALNNAITEASLAASTPRWFVKADGAVREEDYADFRNHFVKVQGRIDEDSIRQIPPPTMPAYPLNYLEHKIAELKEISGNRDVNNGGSTGAVTAASAIAALQEAGNGLSRDMTAASYRASRKGDYLIIELIRQFYDEPRKFRILGEDGSIQYVQYSNAGIQPVDQGSYGAVRLGYRMPMFDIEVVAQSESTYTRQAYNELALQLYQLGAFNPANAESVLLMLDMMDFKGKDSLVKKITNQAQMYQLLLQYQQLCLALSSKYEPELAAGLQQSMAAETPAAQTGSATMPNLSGKEAYQEPKRMRSARQEAQDGSKPR